MVYYHVIDHRRWSAYGCVIRKSKIGWTNLFFQIMDSIMKADIIFSCMQQSTICRCEVYGIEDGYIFINLYIDIPSSYMKIISNTSKCKNVVSKPIYFLNWPLTHVLSCARKSSFLSNNNIDSTYINIFTSWKSSLWNRNKIYTIPVISLDKRSDLGHILYRW